MSDETAGVRYLVGDVEQAIDFITCSFGFTLGHSASPAFAEGFRNEIVSGPRSKRILELFQPAR